MVNIEPSRRLPFRVICVPSILIIYRLRFGWFLIETGGYLELDEADVGEVNPGRRASSGWIGWSEEVIRKHLIIHWTLCTKHARGGLVELRLRAYMLRG